VNDGRKQLMAGAKSAGKDLCIESVRLRLEHNDVAGLRSAMAIAKLLGQDEVVALMEEEPETDRMRPVMKASAPMMSGDEMAAVLRLRRHAR
jgi:ferritin-like metal-binding protein YciE